MNLDRDYFPQARPAPATRPPADAPTMADVIALMTVTHDVDDLASGCAA